MTTVAGYGNIQCIQYPVNIGFKGRPPYVHQKGECEQGAIVRHNRVGGDLHSIPAEKKKTLFIATELLWFTGPTKNLLSKNCFELYLVQWRVAI